MIFKIFSILWIYLLFLFISCNQRQNSNREENKLFNQLSVVLSLKNDCNPRKYPFSEYTKIYPNQKELLVRLASNQKEREIGLSFERNLGERNGMVFLFPKSDYHAFWMKNVYIPLDITFYNELGDWLQTKTIIEIDNSNVIYSSEKKSKFAIETNANFYKINNLNNHHRLTLPCDILIE